MIFNQSDHEELALITTEYSEIFEKLKALDMRTQMKEMLALLKQHDELAARMQELRIDK